MECYKPLRRLCSLVSRTKRYITTARAPRQVGDRQVLNTPWLVVTALASAMAFGDFVVIGQVSATVAGPGIIPSLLIALVASLLSGLCITEFITSQSQQANNLFTYAYQSVGELAAFLIGWTSVLQHLVALAAVCRVQSAIINFLTGMSVHRFFKQVLGRVVVLDTVPDILALGLVLAPAVVVALGLRHSRWMGCFLVTSSTLTAMFFVVIGSLHSDVRNWTESGGFLTKGPGGVLTGAAICIYAFLCPHAVIKETKRLQRPHKEIPVAIGISCVLCFLVCFSMTVVLNLFVRYDDLESTVPLVSVFEVRDVGWARFVMASGALLSLTLLSLETSYPLFQTISLMAADGLIFRSLSKVWDRTGTPAVCILLFALVSSLFAVFLDVEELIEIMATPPLLINTIISTLTLLRRYQPTDAWLYESVFLSDYSPTGSESSGSTPLTYKCRFSIENGRTAVRPQSKMTYKEESIMPKGRPTSQLTFIQGNDKPPYGCPTPIWSSSEMNAKFSGHPTSQSLKIDNSFAPQDLIDWNANRENTKSLATSKKWLDENSQTLAVGSSLGESDTDNEDTSETDIDAIVAEYKEKLKVAAVTHIEGPSHERSVLEPTGVTGRRVTMATGGLMLGFLVMSLTMTVWSSYLTEGYPACAAVTSFGFVLAIIMLLVITRQPQIGPYQVIGQRPAFRVPLLLCIAPIAIFLNVCLLVELLTIVWIPILIWMTIGFVVYSLYGIHRSTAATAFDVSPSRQICLQPFPREGRSFINQIVPSHRSNPRSQRHLAKVDTLLIQH
ncbi:cationic amino acid transporter 4-like [Tachypleus tridentatus]|uniref:cationic amino acid transporter 4-like n=1 Tax=Tachypleus tridentatus TaxID=6853 RepID=UPI003FD45C25